jgi:hypothetical protein
VFKRCLRDPLDVIVRILQGGLYLRQQRPGLFADFVQGDYRK